MSIENYEKEPFEARIKTALIVFSYYSIQEEDRGRDLVSEMRENMQGEFKRVLEGQADALLVGYRKEVLAFGLVDAVKEQLKQLFQESAYVKWVLAGSQLVGFSSALVLLKLYDKMAIEAKIGLIAYCISIVIGFALAHFRKTAS